VATWQGLESALDTGLIEFTIIVGGGGGGTAAARRGALPTMMESTAMMMMMMFAQAAGRRLCAVQCESQAPTLSLLAGLGERLHR
jgi:hypothetical protein